MSVFVETKDQSLPFLVGLEVEDKEVAEAILFILEAGSGVKISPSQLTKHVCSSRKPAEFMKAVFKEMGRFRCNGHPAITTTKTTKKGRTAYYFHQTKIRWLSGDCWIEKEENGVVIRGKCDGVHLTYKDMEEIK